MLALGKVYHPFLKSGKIIQLGLFDGIQSVPDAFENFPAGCKIRQQFFLLVRSAV
jgi:hypothetical protein